MTKQINSLQNPVFKKVLRYQSSNKRIKDKVICVEGVREIKKALSSGLQTKEIFYCPELLSKLANDVLQKIESEKIPSYEVSSQLFKKLAVREQTDGLYVVFNRKERTINDLSPPKYGSYVILDQIEKPGNIGAILRTADATKVSGVLLISKTDLYNPNTIRSSLGAVFTVPVVSCTLDESLDFCEKNNLTTISATQTKESSSYHKINFKQAFALIMGSEDQGISNFWQKNSQKKVMIPMLGITDSLNVSVAAGVLLYEALRQRFTC